MANRDRSGTHIDVPTHPPTGAHTPSPALWLAIAAASATIALTGITFWLSYEALHDLAAGHHLVGARAWAWPATIDAFIVVGEVLILRASLLRRIDWLAVLLVALGSIGSIVLNVVSVGAGVDNTTRVVAAIPPLAALLAFTALMRQIYRALTAEPTGPVAAPVDVPVTVEAQRVDAPVTAPAAQPLTPAIPPQPAVPPAIAPPTAAAPAPAARAPYTNPAHEAIRQLYDTGTRPTTSQMRTAITAAGQPPVSDGGARMMRQIIEAVEPKLADYPAAITTAAS